MSSGDPNKKLKEEVDLRFTDLFKAIGSNRQQLANKVLSLHMDITKELTKGPVNEKRKKEILREVSGMVKIAAQQLPHLKRATPPAPVPPSPKKRK